MTQEELAKLTPEEKRIKIAELCGWTKCRMGIYGNGAPERHPLPYGFPPARTKLKMIPDYLNDLNAMHEVEKHLPEDQMLNYIDRLEDRVRRSHPHGLFPTMCATATQRADALLLTLAT